MLVDALRDRYAHWNCWPTVWNEDIWSLWAKLLLPRSLNLPRQDVEREKKKRGRGLKGERFETANPCMKEKEKRQLFVSVVDGALRGLCLLFIGIST